MHEDPERENGDEDGTEADAAAWDGEVKEENKRTEQELINKAKEAGTTVDQLIPSIEMALNRQLNESGVSDPNQRSMPIAVIDQPASSGVLSEFSPEVVTFHNDPAEEEILRRQESIRKHLEYEKSDAHKEEQKNRLWAKIAAAVGLASVVATIVIPALQYQHDLDKDSTPPPDVPPATWEQIRTTILDWKEKMKDDALFWNRLATYVDNKEKPIFSELEQMIFCNMTLVVFTDDPIPPAKPKSDNPETQWTWSGVQKLAAVKSLYAYFGKNLKITDMYRAIPTLQVERANANTGEKCFSVMNKPIASVVLQICLQQVYELQHPKLITKALTSSSDAQSVLRVASTLSWATPFGPFLAAGFDLVGSIFGDEGKDASNRILYENIMAGVEQIVQTSKREDLIDTVTGCTHWFNERLGDHSVLTPKVMEDELTSANGLSSLLNSNRGSLWGATEAISLIMGDNQSLITAWQAGITLLMVVHKTLATFAAQVATFYREGDHANEQLYTDYLDRFYYSFGMWENAVDAASKLADNLFADLTTRRPAAINTQYQYKNTSRMMNGDEKSYWHDLPWQDGDSELRGWVNDSWKDESVGGKPQGLRTNTQGRDFEKELSFLNYLLESYRSIAVANFEDVMTSMRKIVPEWRAGVKVFRNYFPPPAATQGIPVASQSEANANLKATTPWLKLSEGGSTAATVWTEGTSVYYYVRYWNSKGASPQGPQGKGVIEITVPKDSCHPLLIIPPDVTGMASAIWLYRAWDIPSATTRIAVLKDITQYTVSLPNGTKQIQYRDINDIRSQPQFSSHILASHNILAKQAAANQHTWQHTSCSAQS